MQFIAQLGMVFGFVAIMAAGTALVLRRAMRRMEEPVQEIKRHTTLCYIERGDEWLLLHRVKKEQDANRDKWIGLGGKLEPGESPEACLLREVREEAGLTLTSYRYRGIVNFFSDRWEAECMHLFTADGFSGTPGDCDEGELAWIKKADFAALPQWEGDRIFLRLLEEDAPFFTLTLRYVGETLRSAELNGAKIR